MARLRMALVAAAVLCALLAGGCAKRETPSALYILEELEAASAVKDPAERIERLEIFIANHEAHPYRFLAYSGAIEAMKAESKDDSRVKRFVAEALAKERDPAARGELLLGEFAGLMEKDRDGAIALADSFMRTERSPRLFLYMGYYLMDPNARPDLAVKCFLRSADLATGRYARAHAIAMAAVCLDAQGKGAEARGYLAMAEGDPEADEIAGKLLWAEGKRTEAIDAYIRCAARMPGARKYTRLDSLYALAYPDAKDLDARIASARVGDEGALPAEAFVDLDGRTHDLSKLKGKKVVLYALSPT